MSAILSLLDPYFSDVWTETRNRSTHISAVKILIFHRVDRNQRGHNSLRIDGNMSNLTAWSYDDVDIEVTATVYGLDTSGYILSFVY